jgi:CheY-like chemotaxis protein
MMKEDTERVLVVDDEDDIRTVLEAMLSRQTWTVTKAASGEEARRLCEETRFRAIVLDQRMPVATGTEVARQLKAAGVDAPMVLFSAYLDPAVEEEARAIGMATVSKDDLTGLVETLRPYKAGA